MNKFMDLEEAGQPIFKDLFKELERLHLISQGKFFRLYYKYKHISLSIGGPVARRWEYPWVIINSEIRKGIKVLDAGCGGSPLLLYLYKMGCLCYGIDNNFFDEPRGFSSSGIKYRIAAGLSRLYPFYFWFNPHSIEGLSNPGKTLGFSINYTKGNLTNIPFHDNTFDRIFCISVAEHLSKEDMLKIAREFNRVLKPGGLLIATIDCWGTGLFWKDFVRESALDLEGELNLTPPEKNYDYNVIGLTLRK